MRNWLVKWFEYNIVKTFRQNVYSFCDAITAQAHLPAAKLLQYGDVEDGVAYLSRRVAENRHGIDTPCGAQERRMLWAETKRRLMQRA